MDDKNNETRKANMQYERMKNRLNRPAIGWVYRDPDTKKLCMAGNFATLCEMVARHRKANKLDIPADIVQRIEHEICRTLPDNLVVGRTQSADQDNIALLPVEKQTDELIRKWIHGGRRVVGNDEVVARCEICQKCPSNKRVGCLSCKGIDHWIYSFIGHSRRTHYDGVIHACKHGGFFLMAGIHMTLETLPEPHGVPEHCWRKPHEPTDERKTED